MAKKKQKTNWNNNVAKTIIIVLAVIGVFFIQSKIIIAINDLEANVFGELTAKVDYLAKELTNEAKTFEQIVEENTPEPEPKPEPVITAPVVRYAAPQPIYVKPQTSFEFYKNPEQN